MRKGLLCGWLAVGACVGCGSTSHNGESGAGGTTTAAGATATGGSVAGEAAATGGSGALGGSGAGPGGTPSAAGSDACPELRQPQRQDGTPVDLSFVPLLEGKPFDVAQPASIAGGQLTPLNLRFYVSEVSLEQADGTSVPVDLLSPAGAVEPFGVHLVNFDEPASTTIHFKAPPGSYSGAHFTLGINDACNAGSQNRTSPLSANSEMIWPHVAGYLFLRYEAQWLAGDAAATATPPPTMIHMGGTVGTVFAPQASISGSLVVPAAGTLARSVNVSFDQIFRDASGTEEVTNVPFPTPEVVAGERLRRKVPAAPIFALTEP
jgi:hypothetical protein